MTIARRALQGVTYYRPELAYNGFTLFTPMAPRPSTTWLIDMHGRFLHRWKLAGWVRMHAVLLPNGNLLYGMLTPGAGPLPDNPFTGGAMVEMDWDGNIVWKYEEPAHHSHDFYRMKNGNTLITKYVTVPKDIAARVKGGFPGTERDGVMYGDAIQEITPEGKVAWEWVSYEHLDPELDPLCPIAMRLAWPLYNSLVELPDGDIMTCSPQIGSIHIIDKTTGDIKWRWGHDIIAFPHNPSMLDNGNILVFDNGRHPKSTHAFPPDYSRVVEVNPSTNEIEWEYKAPNPVDFYGTYLSGCERLPNGNTLICEGPMGRFFEVTRSKELVWEYIVPIYDSYPPPNEAQSTNVTFRAHRYGPDYPGLQGKRLDPGKLDLWNRLYGPEAFAPWGRASSGGMEGPITEEREPIEKKEPEAKEEPKPSVARPGEKAPGAAKKEERMRSRLERLGY